MNNLVTQNYSGNIFNANFVYNTGIDTKTNPILVSKNSLLVLNGEVHNESLRKVTGSDRLGDSSINAPTTDQNIFTYSKSLYKVQDSNIYRYRSNYNTFSSVGVSRTLVSSSYTAESNIDEINTIPIISAVYGSYFSYIRFDPVSNYYVLSIFNVDDNVLDYQDTKFLASSSGSVVEMVGTPNGVAIYTASVGSGSNLSETIVNFSNFNYQISNNIETDLFLYVPSVDPYYKYSYPSVSGKFANGLIFLLYRTGVSTNCVGKMIVRNLYGTTTFTNSTLGAPVDLTGVQGFANLGAYSITESTLPYVLFMFGLNFYIVNTGSFSVRPPFSYTTAPGYTSGAEIFSTFNVGILQDTNEFVFLKYNPQQTLTEGTQVCPFINKYNYKTNTWTLYTNTCDPRYNDGKFWSVPGACSLAGGVVGLNSIAYFAVAIFSYIFEEADGAIVASTPVDQRRCTVYLVDSDYNVVEALYSYDVELYSNYDSGLSAYTYSYIPSVPRMKVNAVENSDVSVIYPLFIAQTINDEQDNTFDYTTTVKLIKFSSVAPTTFFSVEFNKSAYFGNSRLIELSNNTISEQSFFDFPQIQVINDDTSGDMTAGGTYAYQAIYQWVNGEGEIVWSAPSISQSVADITGTSMKIYFTPAPFFTQKPGAQLKLYRTINAGVLYQLVYTVALDTLPVGGNWYYVDTMSDDDLEDNEIIYTSGGVLGSFPFPSSAGFVESNGRIWSISRDDTTTVYYSLPERPSVALGFNPSLAVKAPATGGDVVCMGNLDEKLILFKKDSIYVVAGNPANALNQNSTLSLPTLVNSPVGCITPKSVVTTPVGLMFQSNKGIYLLDRSLTVSYIGARVEAYNNYTITSATLLHEDNKVKFSCLEGPVIVYDYYYNEWTVETDLYYTSTVLFQDKYTGLNLAGEVYQANPNVYKRDGDNYKFLVQMPWQKPYGVQGEYFIKDILFLGVYSGQHILRVDLLYNYIDIPQQTIYIYPNDVLGVQNSYGEYTWGSVTQLGGTASSLYQFRINPPSNAVMAFSLQFSDVFQNTIYETGNSFSLTDFTMTVFTKSAAYSAIPFKQVYGATE